LRRNILGERDYVYSVSHSKRNYEEVINSTNEEI
jgi:hypothetical protein